MDYFLSRETTWRRFGDDACSCCSSMQSCLHGSGNYPQCPVPSLSREQSFGARGSSLLHDGVIERIFF